MVLTSQVPRESSSRRYMSRRRRTRWPLWLLLGLVFVLCLVLLWGLGWLPGFGSGDGTVQTGAVSTGDALVEGDRDEDEPVAAVMPGAPESARAIAATEPRPDSTARGTWKPAPVTTTDTTATARPITTAKPPPPGVRTIPDSTAHVTANTTTTADRPATTPAPAARRLEEGLKLVEAGDLVAGRAVLSGLLFDADAPLSAADARRARDAAAGANQQLIWSREVVADDPLVEIHEVQPGELLGSIARPLGVPYEFLEDINRTPATRLRPKQRLKVVRGPFHAVVDKSEFRMDLYLDTSEGTPIYAASFPVGLGEGDSTPPGLWRIAPGSKVVDPDWRNPRTGQYYKPGDPANPIGERWMKLEGLDDHTRGLDGYGIHGTIDPDSIGRQASMGCIRLNDEGIERLFELLQDGKSTVRVVP